MEISLKIISAEHKGRNVMTFPWAFFKELKSIWVQENKCLKKESRVTSHLSFGSLSLLIQVLVPFTIKIFSGSGLRLEHKETLTSPPSMDTPNLQLYMEHFPLQKKLKSSRSAPSHKANEQETTSKPTEKAEIQSRHKPLPRHGDP